MHIRSLVLASIASLALSGSAFAACGMIAMNGKPIDPSRADWCNPESLSPTTGGPSSWVMPSAAVDPVTPPPVVVDPVTPTDPVEPPTEIPSTPLEPGTPAPGAYYVDISGTEFDAVVPVGESVQALPYAYTFPNGTTVPAGVYSVIKAPNGLVRAVSISPS